MSTPQRGTRLLLVEDDEVDRMAIERLVRREHLPWEVVAVGTLREARAQIAEGDVDVILTDYDLPDGQGLDLLEPPPNVPVILITGAGDEELAASALRAGVSDYLVKDIDRGYLQGLVTTLEAVRRRHATELERSMLEQALRNLNDAIYLVDAEGELTYVNESFCHTYGYRSEEVIGRASELLWAMPEAGELAPLVPAQLPSGGQQGECRHRRRDGSIFAVLLSRAAIFDAGGRAVAAVEAVRDISERKRTELQLAHAALHDALTGLPNRALFLDRLTSALRRTQRRKDYSFGVIFLDLDKFKQINDSLGHLVGDQLLAVVARRLEACLRLGDTVARLGGDEFAILLDDLGDPAIVERIAERVTNELEAKVTIEDREIKTGASLGIALSTAGYERPEDVLRDADAAMYRAKAERGGRWVVYEPAVHAEAAGRRRLEVELRQAVERGEFRLHYQPIVALTGGRLRGFEALVRWQHPERGLVTPGEFLRTVQETGLWTELGRWVLEEACRQMAAWQQKHPAAAALTVSVNLDERQLGSAALVSEVTRALETAGLEARCLQLELTEDGIAHHLDLLSAHLPRLHALGVRFYIDDFGTGYSSLGQLNRFPFDALKIDRSFIAHMGGSLDDQKLVRTIVTLGHGLGMTVLAEGVETPAQWRKLGKLGCELAQGYLISRPLTADEVDALLTADRTTFRVDGGGGGWLEVER